MSYKETLAYVTQILFGPECLPNLYMVVTHAGRLAKDSPTEQEPPGPQPQKFSKLVLLIYYNYYCMF